MDPLTGATAFATIVGLLSNFRSERSSGELPEFITWLKEKHHDDLVARLEADSALISQISTLLSINHNELLAKLANLDSLLASIAANVEDFSGLAKAIHPQSQISDQAISVLKQLVDSGAKLFMEKTFSSGEPNDYCLLEGAYGNIKYDEPRLIEDDLNTLVALGLLRLEFGSRGSRRFFITRDAIRFFA